MDILNKKIKKTLKHKKNNKVSYVLSITMILKERTYIKIIIYLIKYLY